MHSSRGRSGWSISILALCISAVPNLGSTESCWEAFRGPRLKNIGNRWCNWSVWPDPFFRHRSVTSLIDMAGIPWNLKFSSGPFRSKHRSQLESLGAGHDLSSLVWPEIGLKSGIWPAKSLVWAVFGLLNAGYLGYMHKSFWTWVSQCEYLFLWLYGLLERELVSCFIWFISQDILLFFLW